MWFKNLQLFKFVEPFAMNAEELEIKLTEHGFFPCRNVDASSQGFTSPMQSDAATLVHAANGFYLFCLQREDKVVPASIVKKMLDEKIAEIEKSQDRKVRKREKETLKEDIYHQLVMRALTKDSKIYGYIDTVDGYLVVDAGTHSKAEEFTVMLRKALGSLKIELPRLQTISVLLTHWLKTNEYPSEFTINDRLVLTDPKEGGTIRCQRQNLFAEDIRTLIYEGRMVSALSLSWAEQISFVLKDDFSIKNLKFLELIQDQIKDTAAENMVERFDADFTIMTETLRAFIREMIKTFGA